MATADDHLDPARRASRGLAGGMDAAIEIACLGSVVSSCAKRETMRR